MAKKWDNSASYFVISIIGGRIKENREVYGFQENIVHIEYCTVGFGISLSS